MTHGQAVKEVPLPRSPCARRRTRASPRAVPRREQADQLLRRIRFFSCFRVGPKPLDKFLAKTARRPRPEMAAQRLEKIESAPGNGMGSEAPSHNIWYAGARLTVRCGREPQERCRIRRAGPEGNFPPRKALKSLETEKESRKPRRRDEQTGDRAAPPLPRRRAARADPRGAGAGAVASRGPESCRKRRLKS